MRALLDCIPDWALLPIGLALVACCWLADGGAAAVARWRADRARRSGR